MVDLRIRGLFVVVLLCSGCVGLSTKDLPQEGVSLPNVRLLEQGAELYVPVPVIMVGFPTEVTQALQVMALEHRIRSGVYLNSYQFPLATPKSVAPPSGPYTIVADFQFKNVSSGFEAAFFDYVLSVAITTGDAAIYNANKIEEWLAERLPREGLSPAANTPSLILVHSAEQLGSQHAYRFTYPNGFLQQVRLFGERFPFLVFDVSAREDPYVVAQSTNNPGAAAAAPYDKQMRGVTKDDAPVLYDLVVHASHFRILQGALYPPSTKPCHAITLVAAVEVASVADAAPMVRKNAAILDKERLQKTFAELMAPAQVFVDTKHMVLPIDDPVLHGLLHGSQPGVRWWIDQNWDKYWIKHDGCEAYVSLIWYPLAGGGGGVAMYSLQDGRRFSLSSASELSRAQQEMFGSGTNRIKWDQANHLYAHETGHLLGLRHPHDLSDQNGPSRRFAFSSIYSAMSYQAGDRMSQFGVVEANNLHRNRAGFLLLEAQRLDVDKGPLFEKGVAALSAYEWREAEALFEQLLAQDAGRPTEHRVHASFEFEERFHDGWV